MTWSYTAGATAKDKVRLLCTDTDTTRQLLQDEEIAVFLEMESSSIRRAAALALETIASQEALILKVVRMLDVQTDGAKLAAELRERAKALRDQADDDEARDDGGFDWAEMPGTEFAVRERLYKQMQRGL